jgi:hypothetical protein
MLTIISARNPVYSNADGTGINLFVTFKELEGEHHFHAVPNDIYQHTTDLYNNAKAGLYGPIGAYAPPNTPAPANQQPTSTGTLKV